MRKQRKQKIDQLEGSPCRKSIPVRPAAEAVPVDEEGGKKQCGAKRDNHPPAVDTFALHSGMFPCFRFGCSTRLV